MYCTWESISYDYIAYQLLVKKCRSKHTRLTITANMILHNHKTRKFLSIRWYILQRRLLRCIGIAVTDIENIIQSAKIWYNILHDAVVL